MRHTTKALLLVPIGLIGLCGFLTTVVSLPRDYYGAPIWATDIIVWLAVSVVLVAIGGGFGLPALGRSFSERRLDNPANILASWRVGHAEWDRFRALDEARSDQFPTFGNSLDYASKAPGGGVPVVIGRRDIRLGDAYRAIYAPLAADRLADLQWLEAEPAAIEFTIYVSTGKNSFLRVARLPVAASAEADARAAFAQLDAAIDPDLRTRVRAMFEDHFLARDVSPARGLIARRRHNAWGVVTIGAAGVIFSWVAMLGGEIPVTIMRWVVAGFGGMTLVGLLFALLYRRR